MKILLFNVLFVILLIQNSIVYVASQGQYEQKQTQQVETQQVQGHTQQTQTQQRQTQQGQIQQGQTQQAQTQQVPTVQRTTTNQIVDPQDPYYADDCAILTELIKAWNKPELISWTSAIGNCCDPDYEEISCDPHHGYPRIAELKLRRKGFTGSLPPLITKLKYLNYLSLAENELTGSIPENMGDLIYLTKLSFRENHMTGKIPESVGNIDGIFHLDFGGNSLTGSIPQSFGNLKQLQFLNLSGNSLDGYIPENFRGLKKLTTLQLHLNKIQGAAPLMENLGNCTYEGTNICYQEGATCESTAHKCTDDEIKISRENNGYYEYSNDSSSSSDCKCDKSSERAFPTRNILTIVLVCIGILAIIGFILACIHGGKNKSDDNIRLTNNNYASFY